MGVKSSDIPLSSVTQHGSAIVSDDLLELANDLLTTAHADPGVPAACQASPCLWPFGNEVEWKCRCTDKDRGLHACSLHIVRPLVTYSLPTKWKVWPLQSQRHVHSKAHAYLTCERKLGAGHSGQSVYNPSDLSSENEWGERRKSNRRDWLLSFW